MFTGIVEAVGRIEAIESVEGGARLCVHAGPLAETLRVASSIAVNGCCLTVVALDGQVFSADLSGETLRRTSFGESKAGSRVNLERPLRAGQELGGHFVQGHVDGVGRVTQLVPEGDNWWLSVHVPDELRRYVAEKGSLAVDGISLTVARWHDGVADIAIIPFTYTHTSVRAMAPGHAVNLECDILAKYVESLLGSHEAPAASRLTLSKLTEEGF